MTGERDITREHAFRYSRLFGCDPANILFPSPQIPVWANVDFQVLKMMIYHLTLVSVFKKRKI